MTWRRRRLGEGRSVSVPVRIGVEPADGFDLGAGLLVVVKAAVTDAGERSVLVIYATEAEVVPARSDAKQFLGAG